MSRKPDIILSTLDADKLYRLIDEQPHNSVFGIDELEAELDRATVVAPEDVPANIVTMNSSVKFSVETNQKEFELTLVYPKDVDASGKTISILAPAGSALLGLSVGDEIEWPKPGGGKLKVKIIDIMYQPERAGEYHL